MMPAQQMAPSAVNPFKRDSREGAKNNKLANHKDTKITKEEGSLLQLLYVFFVSFVPSWFNSRFASWREILLRGSF